MPTTQVPPILLARATQYWLRGRIHFPKDCVGDVFHGKDEDFVAFRKMVLAPVAAQPAQPGAEFIVRFHFVRFSAAVNKRLSIIPAPFIAAQPGFRSKTWMLGQETGMFQGVYEWDSAETAEAYWTSFPMRLMKKRAVPSSLEYEVVAS